MLAILVERFSPTPRQCFFLRLFYSIEVVPFSLLRRRSFQSIIIMCMSVLKVNNIRQSFMKNERWLSVSEYMFRERVSLPFCVCAVCMTG